MKKFWHRHGLHNKVIVEFNYLGQPCGVNTSQLTNFIAYLVKGKTYQWVMCDAPKPVP
jgi:elongation factor P hydroxylase